jgi:hypothetical protein
VSETWMPKTTASFVNCYRMDRAIAAHDFRVCGAQVLSGNAEDWERDRLDRQFGSLVAGPADASLRRC